MKAFTCEVFLFIFSSSLVLDLKVNIGSFDLCLSFFKLAGASCLITLETAEVAVQIVCDDCHVFDWFCNTSAH